MEILNTVFTFVSNNILTKAEFFVGLIVLVGYILLGRKWYETLAGFLKAVVGYMILNVGSAGLINTFRPILAGLNQKFHLNAVVIDPYFGLNAVNAALENIGLSAAWTMTSLLLAFIWNIILLIFRKFTKLRTLLLTGHIMVQQATTVTWIVFLFIPGLRNEGTEKVDYTVYIWYNVSIKYRRCFYDRTTAEIDAKSIHGNI